MLGLSHVRDWLKALNNKADSYYIGKLDNKEEKSIGVYQTKNVGAPRIAVGGLSNTSYQIKGITILIHWNMNARETEEFSFKLYEELLKLQSVVINGHPIKYIKMLTSEPVDVATDDNGVYERVIDLELYYGRSNV